MIFYLILLYPSVAHQASTGYDHQNDEMDLRCFSWLLHQKVWFKCFSSGDIAEGIFSGGSGNINPI